VFVVCCFGERASLPVFLQVLLSKRPAYLDQECVGACPHHKGSSTELVDPVCCKHHCVIAHPAVGRCPIEPLGDYLDWAALAVEEALNFKDELNARALVTAEVNSVETLDLGRGLLMSRSGSCPLRRRENKLGLLLIPPLVREAAFVHCLVGVVGVSVVHWRLGPTSAPLLLLLEDSLSLIQLPLPLHLFLLHGGALAKEAFLLHLLPVLLLLRLALALVNVLEEHSEDSAPSSEAVGRSVDAGLGQSRQI